MCALMYEVKSMSKDPPWTSAITASNRKYQLYGSSVPSVPALLACMSVPAVPSVPASPSVPRELYLTNHC